MIDDLSPGDAARFVHAECMGVRAERRCRPCRSGGRPVRVIAVHEPHASRPLATVRDGSGAEFGAWASELKPAN